MNLRIRTLLGLLALLVVIAAGTGCKKFLSVDPVTAMSGNNFWKTQDDIEKFTTGTYILLRQYTCMDGHTLTAIGDLRCTPWVRSNTSGSNRDYIPLLNDNNMRGFVNSSQWWAGSYGVLSRYNGNANFGVDNLADWGYLYRVITAANTILSQVDEPTLNISPAERESYRAEALFIRAFTYFLMVRHWGDVPYVTDVNDKTDKPRMNQIELLKNLLTDLKGVVDYLPWTHSDPTKRGVRAMKGGALALMMEMNMWMANFDAGLHHSYYQEVVRLGTELIDNNGGAYSLLPIESYKQIFKGTSRESLFEIGQDYNFGETFGLLATVADIVLRTPYKKNVTATYIMYERDALHQLYDEEQNGPDDRRVDLWFERPYMFDMSGQFVFTKFVNTFAMSTETENPNDNRIYWRYADAFLLRAEAYERLGLLDSAVADLNVIRSRAGAVPFVRTGETNQFDQTIEDAVWWERQREKMGEGAMFYDLVRTKKILSGKYTPNPITYDDYINGAWTYPIHVTVLQKNPRVKPNTFWM